MFCLVLGEIPARRNLFTVSITDDITIGSKLRSEIYEKKKQAFTNIDENKLILWKVNVPINNEEDMSMLDEVSQKFLASCKINIERDFKGEELFPTDSIPDFYREQQPPKVQIVHIIVQPPPPTTTDQRKAYIYRVIEDNGYLPRQFGRGGTLLCKDEENAYTAEGISLTDPDISQRSELVSHLAKSLEQKKVILVRAPPYSGKTSLAQLLENYLVNSSKQYRVIRVSLLWGSSVGRKWEYNTFGEEIYKDLNKADESIKNTVTAEDFWDVIKLSLQGSNLNIIMFAAYGEYTNSAGLSTPVSIPLFNSMGPEEIKFSNKELETYIKDYCCNYFDLSSDDYIISQFIRYIEDATVGHVGFVRHILEYTTEAMYYKIRYRNLTWKRIFPEKICQDVCLKGKIRFTDSDDNKYLINSGILVIVVIKNQSYLQFAAPLIERSFLQQCYGESAAAVSTPDSLYDFIKRIFIIMSEESGKILNGVRGTGKNKRLLETWQNEFYRVGTRALGNDHFLLCVTGVYYGSEGYMDFYVDGLDWAIEFLREDLNMEKRNTDNKEIVKVVNETAIIDILSNSKKVRKLKKGFVYVSYSENHDAYMIECLGKETVKIEIR